MARHGRVAVAHVVDELDRYEGISHLKGNADPASRRMRMGECDAK